MEGSLFGIECESEVKESEEQLKRKCEELDYKIKQLESEKKKAKDLHNTTIRYMQHRKEREFYKVYGQQARVVRKSYDDRLEKLVEPCGKCHDVKLLDLDFDVTDKEKLYFKGNYVKELASHISLPVRHYEQARLSKMEEDAFAVIDKKIWIDPEAHCEIWGN